MSISKEVLTQIAKDMKNHLSDGTDFLKFTMELDNIHKFQRMPETKSGNPAKLGYLLNPEIEGKTARRDKYFWNANAWIEYCNYINKVKDEVSLLLKVMEKINPNAIGSSTTSSEKVHHSYK